MRALKRNVHDVCCTCTCSFKPTQWLLGGCASSSRRWPRVAHQPKQPSSSSWQHFPLCFLCGLPLVTWSLSALPRTTNNTVAAWSRKRKCFAVTKRCFLRTKSEKLFPSRPSFLRRRTSTGFASKRFSRLQSENQKDSRLGRVRNYHLWRDLRVSECPTDKNGESWDMRLCHVFEDRPSVHACVPS